MAGVEVAGRGPVGDAPGEHPGLARAGAGQDAQRVGRLGDGGALRLVEAVEQARSPSASRSVLRRRSRCRRGVPPQAPERREELVLDLRPHWIFLAPSVLLLVSPIVIGLVRAGGAPTGHGQDRGEIAAAPGAGRPRLLRDAYASGDHATSCSPATGSSPGMACCQAGHRDPARARSTPCSSTRAFRAHGRRRRPHHRVGRQRRPRAFTDIRHPAQVQREIYVQMEANSGREVPAHGAVRLAHSSNASAARPRCCRCPSSSRSSTSSAATGCSARPSSRPRRPRLLPPTDRRSTPSTAGSILAVLCVALSVIIVDETVLNVAVPALVRELQPRHARCSGRSMPTCSCTPRCSSRPATWVTATAGVMSSWRARRLRRGLGLGGVVAEPPSC